jgi:hypothetical protein
MGLGSGENRRHDDIRRGLRFPFGRMHRLIREQNVSAAHLELSRIHFDLDFWRPVAGYRGVWELRPEAIRRGFGSCEAYNNRGRPEGRAR